MNFPRKNWRLILFWPLLALFLSTAGWGIVLTELRHEQQKIETDALQDAETNARSYAQQLDHGLTALDQLTLYVKYAWELSRERFKLESVRASGLLPANNGFYISIIDAQGNLRSSTNPRPSRINVANETFFTVHRDSANRFYIGTPRIEGFSHRHILIPFSRALTNAAGGFGGIVLVSATPAYFISGYDEVSLGKTGFLGIFSNDGLLRLARIGNQLFLSDDKPLLGKPAWNVPSGSAVFNGSQWFPDGRSRFMAWQVTGGYQMTVMAGLDRDEVLAGFRKHESMILRGAMLGTATLMALSVAASVLSLRLAWRKRQYERMQATYRTATEGGIEGFFIACPKYDAFGNVMDFKFADCTARGAQMLRLRREELIGNTLLDLFHGEPAKILMNMMRKAMVDRMVETELDLSRLDPSRSGWLHVRIARPEEDLAVTLRDISDMKAHVAELERRGNEDALTGLPNRHWANTYLQESVTRAGTAGQKMALLFIDLDGFKAVNDTMGHEAGDEILRNAGRRMKDAVRPHDHVVRMGGDEFLVILDKVATPADASHVAERILDAFRPTFRVTKGMHAIGASIGISIYPDDATDAASLLNNADIAMYSVKTGGKRGYRFFDRRFYDVVRERHQREAELREAIEKDQLILYYQPRVDVLTGVTSSMEALVRWAHPTRGLIEPNEFIPLAEETGLIVRLGEQVIDKVCAQLAQWSRTSGELVPISINVSARQFHETRIASILAASVSRHRIPPHLLEVEITESSMAGNSWEAADAMRTLHGMGIRLLVDDFGTGYSSLSQLQRLDFDVLKVDRTFTLGLENSNEGTALFTAIITMAHALGMRVVAEGVETLAQIRTLKSLRCDEVQGFYISRPLPPSDTQPVLPRWFFPSTA